MTLARLTLDDIGGGLSCRALVAFVRNLPAGSALARETRDAELWAWSQPAMTNQLLAALVDELRMAEWAWARSNGARGARRPRPIPRPGVKDDSVRRIGSDPIPISEFEDFWNGGPSGEQ